MSSHDDCRGKGLGDWQGMGEGNLYSCIQEHCVSPLKSKYTVCSFKQSLGDYGKDRISLSPMVFLLTNSRSLTESLFPPFLLDNFSLSCRRMLFLLRSRSGVTRMGELMATLFLSLSLALDMSSGETIDATEQREKNQHDYFTVHCKCVENLSTFF